MRLKEFIRVTFSSGVLDVYAYGKHEVSQPFNSDTGNRFVNQDEAMAWLVRYYPSYFTL
jgi:hypothetical protein